MIFMWKDIEIISSPAFRAQETIQIICENLRIDTKRILTDTRIEERWYGDWEWRKESEIMTSEMLRTMDESRWQFRPPNGDSIQDIYDRTKLFLDAICGTNKHYLICSHGFTIRCILGNILGVHPGDIYRNTGKPTAWVYNTGVIGLDEQDGELIIVNDLRVVPFLPENLRTK